MLYFMKKKRQKLSEPKPELLFAMRQTWCRHNREVFFSFVYQFTTHPFLQRCKINILVHTVKL